MFRRKLYGAIVWEVHKDTGDVFLTLEKRNNRGRYPDTYVTFLTGANFTPITLYDQDMIAAMIEYARSNNITLTTDRVTVKYV